MAAAVGTSCIPPPVSTGNPTAGTAADAGPEGGGGPSTPSAAAAAAAATAAATAVKGGGDCDGFNANVNQQTPSAAANGVGAAGGGAEVLRPEAGSSIASAAAAAAASSGKTASRRSSGDSEDGGDVADACATQTSAAVMPADGGGDTTCDDKTGGGDDDKTATARSSSSSSTMAPPPPESTPTARGRTLVSLQLKKEELLPPPVLPPSACTTPAESPRNPDPVMDAFRSPAASPWLAGGGGGGGGVGFRGRQGGASAAAVAAGARSGGGDRSSAWRSRTGSGGGGGGGSVDAFCVSPFSPRVSPRALMSSPVGIDGPARDGSFSLSSSPSSQRGAFAGSGRLEGSDWWKGLDLSPDRSGLPRWRESRKPVAMASSLPSDNVTENDGGGKTKTTVEMTSGAVAAGLHDGGGGGGVRGLLSPSSSSSARMSRSYMTLLAAAAAEETTKGRRQQGGGVPGRATGEVSATEQAFQPVTVEGRLRQLEAENLRLRFRVADLEGQVSVMEDELDRRGVARPMPADANSSSNAESCRTGIAGTAVVASADDKSNACRVTVEAAGAVKTVKAAAAAAAAAATSPKSRGVEGGGGGEAGAGMVNDGPLLSPRGRGYLARLVLEVCSEIEDSKKAATEAKAKGGASTNTVTTRGDGITSRPRSIPHSERLCKVLPKVMETAIRGVKDLDEQVFEQMMRTASERSSGMSMSMSSMSSLSSPSHGGSLPLGTPARRLSSCVVARDGGGEFFAQSPAPGRPASFFRLVGEPKTPAGGDGSALRRTSSGSSIKVVRTGSAWDATPMKKIFTGGKQGKKAAAAAAATPHKNARETPLRTPRSGGAGGFFGAGDWLAAAFTPRGALAPDPESPRAPASEVPKQQQQQQQQQPPEEEVEQDEGIAPLAPSQPLASSRPPPEADALSFEGSTEEVLRYTIVAKSYLIRSKSKKHGESREASPIKSLFSPGGTERRVEEGGEEDVRHLTKELLDLKSRYMASTQHWLKTDIVNDEELRMIRAQVFEAIQRKRSELHTEAAAVLRAERLEESLVIQHNGGSNSKSSRGCGDGDSGAGGWGTGGGGGGGGGGGELSLGNGSTSGKDENKAAAADATAAAAALREEEEANRTIAMLEGTAEFLKFSRLLLLLSEAISVSNSVTTTNSAAAAAAATDGATSNRRNAGGGGGGSRSTTEEEPALIKSKMPPPPPVAPGAAAVPEILTAVARARGSGRKRR